MGDVNPEDLKALALGLQRLLQLADGLREADDRPPPLIAKVLDHLGCDMGEVVSVVSKFEAWEHVNVHRAVEAYLAGRTPEPEWFGISGQQQGSDDLVDMLVSARRQKAFDLGAAEYATAAIGPEESVDVVQLGLTLTRAPDGTPVLVGIRGYNEYGPPACRLEVLAGDRSAARATGVEVERLMREHNALRGQVLAFGVGEHRGNGLVTFLPRPTLGPDDVVLPDGLLDSIERHVVGIAEHSEKLLAAGQHLKRGLLLHGPPGTGKTHTVRYLMSRLEDCTVILVTGPAMRFLSQAAALARRLQPSMVVIEDVDLIAMDRDHPRNGSSPLLFALLDTMDGVGADADVTFVLTTNRADELERALTDRPGRIDLAVEVPRPDAEGRLRLLQLYGRDVDLRADLAPVVEATEGVTASFIKELLRRAVLEALRRNGSSVPVVGDELLDIARDMTDQRHALTSALLGGKTG
ncbi:ATP-binding protein [Saccharothrix sp.]|uniref:ATP-binding protein n=1 Tax=Saccharothrix sp. TaxID=1873460 RepID=UPI00281199EF|nr:ATP-binding protein [Saccharothrix sp.]